MLVGSCALLLCTRQSGMYLLSQKAKNNRKGQKHKNLTSQRQCPPLKIVSLQPQKGNRRMCTTM